MRPSAAQTPPGLSGLGNRLERHAEPLALVLKSIAKSLTGSHGASPWS
jgi:hypothetical protein